MIAGNPQSRVSACPHRYTTASQGTSTAPGVFVLTATRYAFALRVAGENSPVATYDYPVHAMLNCCQVACISELSPSASSWMCMLSECRSILAIANPKYSIKPRSAMTRTTTVHASSLPRDQSGRQSCVTRWRLRRYECNATFWHLGPDPRHVTCISWVHSPSQSLLARKSHMTYMPIYCLRLVHR